MSEMKKITLGKIRELASDRREAFVTLRTNLQFGENDAKVIAVTSCNEKEGKTDVAFNLALALAEDGNKVLFLDGDFRKSSLAEKLNVGKSAGFVDYLEGKTEKEQIFMQTDVDGLQVVFAGRETSIPTELLNSKKYIELIKEVREQYDYVLIDTPALGSVVDCIVAAQQTDGVLMVVESQQVSYKKAQQVKQQLEANHIRILGAVLNKVSSN